MDVHDCRFINHFCHSIYRFKFFPKWLYARIAGKTNRKFTYDSSVMYVDACLKKLILHLKKNNLFDDTLLLLTADHGSHFAESPRKKNDIGYRTYYEDIEVPMVIVNSKNKNISNNLCDSMGVTASFLDALNIDYDPSFKGKSVFKNGVDVVISENCGKGNADLKRRNIYFTVR